MNDQPGAGDAQGEGPGPALTRAREALGLSEQQAAEQLNLDPSVIYALESGDLAALGAPVFARGHLKRYGGLLGLPQDELLAAYDRARTQPEQPSLVPHSRQEMAPVRERSAGPWAAGGAVLFLLAAGVIAYVSQFGFALPWRTGVATQADEAGADAATSAPLETSLTPPGAAGASNAIVDAGNSAPPATGDAGGVVASAAVSAGAGSAAGMPAGAPVLAPGQVMLSMSFAADSWAEIYDGAGKAVLYDLGRAGSQRTLTATAPLSVTFGNAPAVTLVVNGRSVSLPPVPAGQTLARFKVQPDGTLR